MCVQCVMGAAVGFGVFQAYRFVIKDRATVIKDRARTLLRSRGHELTHPKPGPGVSRSAPRIVLTTERCRRWIDPSRLRPDAWPGQAG